MMSTVYNGISWGKFYTIQSAVSDALYLVQPIGPNKKTPRFDNIKKSQTMNVQTVLNAQTSSAFKTILIKIGAG